MANSAELGAVDTITSGWDFSDTETETEAGVITEPSTAPNSPDGTDDGTVRTIGDKRCSRFVVEAEPRSDLDLDNSNTEEKATVSPTESIENGEVNDTDDVGGVKKGRFSVLESAIAERDNPSPPTPIIPNASSVIEGELEEGRRSRFKVEPASVNVVANPNLVNVVDSPDASTTRSGGQNSRFHVSAARERDNDSVDSIPAPYPRGAGGSYAPLYEDVGNDASTLHNGVVGGAFPRDYTHPHSSLIFVHPSQFDQLLLLNELIRQQLIELRNSSRRQENYFQTTSASYHPTIHNNGGGFHPELWEGRPMVEDPHVSFPPHLSAYSPNSSAAFDSPWNVHQHVVNTDIPRPMDPRIFAKRRSMSIDQRAQATTSTHQSQLFNGMPRTLGGSAGVHRTVHSLKSPLPVPSEIGMESLRRELEMLRKENELLRKKPSP